MFKYSRFESLRAEKGIKKTFIAECLDRTPTICQDWKKGKSVPNDEQLAVLANVLNTTVDYLTGKTDQKEKPTLVSESGLDALDAQLMELLRLATPEQKRAWIALLKNTQQQE